MKHPPPHTRDQQIQDIGNRRLCKQWTSNKWNLRKARNICHAHCRDAECSAHCSVHLPVQCCGKTEAEQTDRSAGDDLVCSYVNRKEREYSRNCDSCNCSPRKSDPRTARSCGNE